MITCIAFVEYGDVIYDSCSKADSGKLENVQLEAAQIVTAILVISNFIFNFVRWNYLMAEKTKNWKNYIVLLHLIPLNI